MISNSECLNRIITASVIHTVAQSNLHFSFLECNLSEQIKIKFTKGTKEMCYGVGATQATKSAYSPLIIIH